jgi:hypothetical protein
MHNSPQLDRMLKYINLVHNLTSSKFNSHLMSSSHVHYIAYPKYPHPLSDYKFVGTSRSPKRVTCRLHLPLALYFTVVSSYSSQGLLSNNLNLQSDSLSHLINGKLVVQLGKALRYNPVSREFHCRWGQWGSSSA